MRHLAAYILAVMGGNSSPSQAELNKILSSVGIETDPELMEKVVSLLSGKNLDELFAEGRKKLASVPTGGAVAVPANVSEAPKVEAVKETKEAPKEEEEDEDGDMGFGLFD